MWGQTLGAIPMWGQTPAMVQGPWSDIKFLIDDADGHYR